MVLSTWLCYEPERRQLKWLTRDRNVLRPSDEIDAFDSYAFDKPPQVPLWRFVFGVFSILGLIADVATDVWVCLKFLNDKSYVASLLVAVFFIIPAMIVSSTNAVWYYQDYSRNKNIDNREKYPVWIWVIRALSILFFIAPVSRYIESLRYLYQYRKSDGRDRELYTRMLEEDRDATMLRLVEGFLEAAPQLLIQSYYFTVSMETTWPDQSSISIFIPQVPSLVFSLMSLAWIMVAQHRCLRFVRCDKKKLSVVGTVVIFFWRLCTISSRILSINWFLYNYHWWITLILTSHFGMTTVYLLCFVTNHLCNDQSCLEFLFNFILSLIHIFVPFNVAEGRTRYRYIFFYSIEFGENLFMLLLPLTQLSRSFLEPPVRHCPIVYFIMIGVGISLFIIGILLMLIYYKWFHPNGPFQSGCSRMNDEQGGHGRPNVLCWSGRSMPEDPVDEQSSDLASVPLVSLNKSETSKSANIVDLRANRSPKLILSDRSKSTTAADERISPLVRTDKRTVKLAAVDPISWNEVSDLELFV